jgi:hypothetical protein
MPPVVLTNRNLFFKAAAARSVESMIATVLRFGSSRSSKGRNRCPLICRSEAKLNRSRNWWSILASGTLNRFGSRANFRQERFSGKSFTNRLNERAGVSSGNNDTRNNCAADNPLGRPTPRRAGHKSLIQPSSMCSESCSNKPEVPVWASRFMPPNLRE